MMVDPVGDGRRARVPMDGELRSYLEAVRNQARAALPAGGGARLSALVDGAELDALDVLVDSTRLAVLGQPGCGKSGLLQAAVLQLAERSLSRADGVPVEVPMYADLASARAGEGLAGLAARMSAGLGLGTESSAGVQPTVWFLDHAERAADTYLLEEIGVLLSAGGVASPALCVACRDGEWEGCERWLGSVPEARLLPAARDEIRAFLMRALPSEAAEAAEAWLELDAGLAELASRPRGLAALMEVVSSTSRSAWRRADVLAALLRRILVQRPESERSAYRAALADVAYSSRGRAFADQVDTMAMGLGVTRDVLIASGVVVARGADLQFVEPLLAEHCAALALVERFGGSPRRLVERLAGGGEPDGARTSLEAAVMHVTEEPAAFLRAVLAGEDGPRRAARCLLAPDAADPGGPLGRAARAAALVDPDAPESVDPERAAALATELARLGAAAAAAVVQAAAVERANSPAAWPSGGSATKPIDRFRELLERGRALDDDDLEGAAAMLREAAGLAERLEAESVLAACERALQAGDAAEAMSRARAALELLSGDPRALIASGRARLMAGDARGGLEDLEHARSLMPASAEVAAATGRALREAERIEEAAAHLADAAALAPHRPQLEQESGELLAEIGQLEDAEAAMQRAVALRPDEVEWHDALGQVLLELGRWQAAAQAFEKACTLAPDDSARLRRLARARAAAGDATGAVALLSRAAGIAGDEPGLLADLGRALARAGDRAGAIEALRAAVLLDDIWPEDHLLLARLLREAAVERPSGGQDVGAGLEDGRQLLADALAHAERAALLAPSSAEAVAEREAAREAASALRPRDERANDPVGPADFPAPAVREDAQAASAPAIAKRDDVAAPAAAAGAAAGDERLVDARPGPARSGSSAGTPAAGVDGWSAAEVSGGADARDRADDEAAYARLAKAAEAAPGDARVARLAGEAALRVGRAPEAVRHLSVAVAGDPKDADLLRSLAAALGAIGQARRAHGVLRRAVELRPADPSLHLALVAAARSAGDLESARYALQRARAAAGPSADLEALEGEIAVEAGDASAAEAAYERAVSAEPNNVRYRMRLVGLLSVRRPQRALELLESGPPVPEVLVRLAELRMQAGDLEGADEAYQRLADAALASDDLDALDGSEPGSDDEPTETVDDSVLPSGEGDRDGELQPGGETDSAALEEAVRSAEEAAAAGWEVEFVSPSLSPAVEPGALEIADAALAAVATAPPDLVWRAARSSAVLRARSGHVEGARHALATMDSLGSSMRGGGAPDGPPMDAERTLLEAWLHLVDGDADAALGAARLARALGLEDARTHGLSALTHSAAGEPALALGAMRAACDLAPNAGALRGMLAKMESAGDGVRSPGNGQAEGGPDASAESSQDPTDEQRRGAEDWWALAESRREAGDRIGAREALERAVYLAPERDAWQARLGNLLRQLGEHEAAGERFARAMALEPRVADYRCGAAEVALAMADRDAARAAVEEALALDPGCARARALLGRLELDDGHVTEARATLAAAAKDAPDDPEVQRVLGLAAKAAGDVEAAVEALELAARLDSSSTETFRYLGSLYAERGDVDEAIQALQQAVVASPNDFEAHLKLGVLCASAGLPEKAERHLRLACGIEGRDPRPHRELARLLAEREDLDGSLRAFADALELLGRSGARAADLCIEAGDVALGLHDHDRAKEWFQRAHEASASTTTRRKLAAVGAISFIDRLISGRQPNARGRDGTGPEAGSRGGGAARTATAAQDAPASSAHPSTDRGDAAGGAAVSPDEGGAAAAGAATGGAGSTATAGSAGESAAGGPDR